jgi:hypothetical protein
MLAAKMLFESLILASTVTAAVSQSCLDKKNCVYSSVSGDMITFTIHSSATGWAAFGVGGQMVIYKFIVD